MTYKVQPNVNHSHMYNTVFERLVNNGVVGISPEGYPHDRASLLPLNAKIAVVALGACDNYGEALRSKLKIFPVGLYYVFLASISIVNFCRIWQDVGCRRRPKGARTWRRSAQPRTMSKANVCR